MAKSVGVILAAAGKARRMGMGRNKAYIYLQGRPILAYSLQFFAAWPEVQQVVIVTSEDEMAACQQLIAAIPAAAGKTMVVLGGEERQDSVAQGLAAMPVNMELIVVHDAARPLVDAGLFTRVLTGDAPGVIPALPISDTVKMVTAERLVVETVPRQGLYLVQTPQVFAASVLRECYARAVAEGFYGTDDASLLEHYGYRVQIVAGEKYNLKITTPFDLEWAEYWLHRLNGGD